MPPKPTLPNMSRNLVWPDAALMGRLATFALVALGCVIGLQGRACAAFSAESVQNSYLQVIAGVSGDVSDAGPNYNTTVKVAGYWTVATTGGEPHTADDNGVELTGGALFQEPWGCYTAIKVDEADAVIYGSDEGGAWTRQPSADENKDIITDSYLLKSAPINISRVISIERDVIRVSYSITNNDTAAHKIGLATFMDTDYGYDQSMQLVTGGPFWTVRTGSVTNEQELTGSDVPDVVFGFDNLPQYKIVTKTILRGADATTPDSVMLTNAGHAFGGDFWDLAPIATHSILEQSGLVLLWNQKSVAANATMSPTTFYFGLGHATEDYSYPAVLALQAPFSLEYNRPAGDDLGDINPQPTTVYGYVYNRSDELPLSNVQVQLALDAGLQFAPGETPTKTIGDIGIAGGEGQVKWQILADRTQVGPVNMTLSVVGFPLTAKAVTRSVNIPAVEDRLYPGNTWQLISVPFRADDPTPAAMLGLTPGSFAAKKFNPATGLYADITTVQPGDAFWFKPLNIARVIVTNADPLPNSTTGPYVINLKAGWNQIGNPFLYGISWGRFRVLRDPIEGSVPLATATERNWLRATVYWYNATTNAYEASSSPDTQIIPWRGYWVRAFQPLSLIVPGTDTIGGSVVFTSRDAGGGGGVTPPLPPLPPGPPGSGQVARTHRSPAANGAFSSGNGAHSR
ncbi:MAG: hypothetical protein IT209_13195 [Armatimonadetes bacterium]|nr:hypothetical protein [Armatimonadota bacterium]